MTADAQFAPMAAHYGFADHAAAGARVAALVRAKRLPVVTEPGVDSAAVLAVAAQTHAKIDFLDALTVATPEEQARRATYLSLMTDDLAKLRSALACDTST